MKTQFFSNAHTLPTMPDAEKCLEVVTLRSNEIMRLKKSDKQLRIKCLGGIAWITQPDDPEDYILQANETIDITKKGLVLVQALPETTICI
ncbi:MAG: DUF2917 domain-containing protein [Chloroflexi bacterium]|nr:DUF2917 domain-containing protein [Chloroflexota bacterium]